MKGAFPINVLNAIKTLPRGLPHLLRHRQPRGSLLAETEQGRGILGVVDGVSPKGVEDKNG